MCICIMTNLHKECDMATFFDIISTNVLTRFHILMYIDVSSQPLVVRTLSVKQYSYFLNVLATILAVLEFLFNEISAYLIN